jgi:hypothetical protein
LKAEISNNLLSSYKTLNLKYDLKTV